MSENHIEQLKAYFINLAGNKVDSDFGLDQCQEALDGEVAIDKDTRKTFNDDLIDETDDNEEQKSISETKEEKQGAKNNGDELNEDTDTDYVNDEQNRDDQIHEEPIKLVSKNNYDFNGSSRNLRSSSPSFVFLSLLLYMS